MLEFFTVEYGPAGPIDLIREYENFNYVRCILYIFEKINWGYEWLYRRFVRFVPTVPHVGQIKDYIVARWSVLYGPVFIVAAFTVGAVSCSKNCNETSRAPSTNIVFKYIIVIIMIVMWRHNMIIMCIILCIDN